MKNPSSDCKSDCKIAAYITSYRDAESVIRCASAISSQSVYVNTILILENSPEGSSFSEVKSFSEIVVNHQPSNKGIAFGLHWAMSWASENTFDFLWVFDQDSSPKQNCLDHLLSVYLQYETQGYKIGIVACNPIDPRTHIITPPAKFRRDHFDGMSVENQPLPYECDAPITSGALLNVKSFSTVQPSDIRLFIDGIDLEYGLRLTYAGFKNIVVPSAVMDHNFGMPTEVSFLGRVRLDQRYSALRYYYICRNHTYLELKFSKGLYKVTCVLRRIKFLMARLFWIPVIEPEGKLQKMLACLRGTYYGLIGDLDQHFYTQRKPSWIQPKGQRH